LARTMDTDNYIFNFMQHIILEAKILFQLF
jgi:hypothetical protein